MTKTKNTKINKIKEYFSFHTPHNDIFKNKKRLENFLSTVLDSFDLETPIVETKFNCRLI